MKDNVEAQYVNPAWMIKTGGHLESMTLRDHFAGLAMQAQLSMPEIGLVISQGTITIENVCRSCYEWADAMLKERAK